ncbi:MAG: winged helix-turn-helix domain-containing protein [Woeseiaceae bacterium]|nr:winged helix-turn-helix domain-containing protein [Woeseiaceae bacterium]
MSNESAQSTGYRVADLVIDAGTHEVRRSDERIKLPKLSFRLLLALAEAAPNLLSHDELVGRVWPGRVVSPETVTQRVKLLRRALGDDAANPRYIGLVRGEGYRLLADVERIDTPARKAGASARRPLAWASIAAAGILVAIVSWRVVGEFGALNRDAASVPASPAVSLVPDSVAILPFTNASENADDAYIVDGLGDRLREQLGNIGGFQVVARASSVAARNRGLSIAEIAERLRVEYVIEGTLVRERDDLRISVQLIDTTTGFQTWSMSYDRNMAGLIEMQQQIAGDVARQLLPELENEPAALRPITANVTANDYMMLARERELAVRENYLVDIPKMIEAIKFYRLAIAADPDLVEAHSRLGGALLYIGDSDSAGKSIYRAMSMEPDNAEAQYNLGLYLWARELPGSGEAYRKAMKLNPSHADAHAAYANWLWHQDDPQDPEHYYLKALSLDRLALNRYADLGLYYGILGRRDDAFAVAADIKEQFESWRADMVLARLYEVTGDIDVAIAHALRAHRAEPESSDPKGMLAELYARIGDFDNARNYEPTPGIGQLFWRRQYDDLVRLAEDAMIDNPDEIQIKYTLARAYNATGQFDLTINLLERTRLRERVAIDSRRARGKEALTALADAYYETGRREDALKVAAWVADMMDQYKRVLVTSDWWPNAYHACALSTLRRDDEALTVLQAVVDSPGLVWYPLLVDAVCFRRLEGEPRYEAVVAAVEQRMQSLRERVPETLARFDPELVAEN